MVTHVSVVHSGVSAPSRALPVLWLLLAVACTARLNGVEASPDGDPPTGLTPGGAGSGAVGQGQQSLDCSTTRVGFAPLKRLTREQYDNSIRDLLGVESHPAASLSADEKLAAFYSNTVSPVTRLSVEQYADVAEELARAAVEQRLDALVGCSGAAQDSACAGRFIQDFGLRAFREPLSAEQLERYHGLFDAYQARGFAEGIRLVLQTMLQSPSFLYHLELAPAPSGAGVTPLGGYELASRLSFALWNTLPDAELLTAAASGELGEQAGLQKQAARLLANDRARGALASFHLQWLGLDDLADSVKDAQLFPGWTSTLKGALREETVSFADFVIRRGDGRLQTLLSAPFTVASPELLAFYGVSGPAGADGTVQLNPAERAGLLTQGAFLAAHAHANQTSPVHRGLAVRKNLLCTELPDPPMNVDNTPPEPDPQATTRQRFEQHRDDASCAGCHRLLDPIGVGFENYDATGRYRLRENELDIDASGELLDAGSASGTFNGAVELAQRLSTSTAVRDCVQKQWFRFALGRLEAGEDDCSLQRLAEAFAASDYDVKALLLALVSSDAFRYRKVEP